MYTTVTVRSKDISARINTLCWTGEIISIQDAASEAENMIHFMQPDQIKSVEIHIDYGDQTHDRNQGV